MLENYLNINIVLIEASCLLLFVYLFMNLLLKKSCPQKRLLLTLSTVIENQTNKLETEKY